MRYNSLKDGEPEPKSAQKLQKMQKTLLDINPEGHLFIEIKDIIEELFIMTQIKTQEELVVRNFVKLAKIILYSKPMGLKSRSELSISEMRNQRPSLTQQQPSSFLTEQFDMEWSSTGLVTDVLDSLKEQHQELESLRQSAETVSKAVSNCLKPKSHTLTEFIIFS